jgi:uncharacterized protein YciI
VLFALICHDKPASLDLRLALRPQHLAFTAIYGARIVHGGPLLDADGRPCGSLMVIDVEDRAAAEGFVADDPFTKAGLFETMVIRGFRAVFRDGDSI